ncbi:MAG TPA: DUF6295 family protein [Acidimicrobiales bacterium]|jgi:hypothetical protein
MCSYITEQPTLSGSAKGGAGWFRIQAASVYFDHPQHALDDHTLNVDLLGERPDQRLALELSAEAARALVTSIEAALAAGEASHLRSSGRS